METNEGIKKFPVVEIFGPVLQGEGAMIGVQTVFIRFGGCDYKCTMCDSMIAVDSAEIKKRALMLTAKEVIKAVGVQREAGPVEWITLSGGNPCMWDIIDVVMGLKELGMKLAVETQGSIYQHWLKYCDNITISPKGPGMGTWTEPKDVRKFSDSIRLDQKGINLKIVIFGDPDLEYAKKVVEQCPDLPLYLSVGNPYLPEQSVEYTRQLNGLLASLRWLETKVPTIPELSHARILPQMHVLLHGNKQGV